MSADPYITALVAGFAVAFAVSAALNLAAHRLPEAEWGGLAGVNGGAPLAGGIALLAAFALAPFLAAAVSTTAAEYFDPKRDEFLGFLAAASVVFLTGLIDDRRPIHPWQKLAGQIAAGVAVYLAGYRLDVIGFPWGGEIDFGVLALPATLLWVVFFTNALNLVDGKDGLATGVALFAAAALAAVAANSDHPAVALLFVALAGAGLGFLPFNLPPASLYLGDSGALVFGFVLSALSIRGATGAEGVFFIAVPVLAMGFPVLDTVLSTLRRLMASQPLFVGDLDHIHHRMEATGLGPRGSLAALYGLAVAFAATALATHYIEEPLAEVAIFLGLVALIGVVLVGLGYLRTMWQSERLVALRRRPD